MQKFLRTVLLFAFTLLGASIALHAQDRLINGTVTDDKGGALPGVSVTVKNTKISVITNVNGQFTLNVPTTGSTLVVSFVGMNTREIAIGSNTSFNIQLNPSATNLSEVVVVGYGTAKRANLTTAQTTITSKELNRTVNTTIEQAIQGRSAGVYITQNSGQPGGGISVNIRGVNSINGANEPLYVIDGIQIQGEAVSSGAQSSSNPLAGLNPADIEDIQVLQGPSATSIYGSRATNGVLLITTKRGKSGDVRINYGFQHGIQGPPKSLDVMNLRQYAQMINEFKAIAGGTVQLEYLDPSLLGPGTDWQSELFKNAAMNKHQLSLSGGSDKTTYFLSGDYLNQDGVAAGSGFKRYSFRLNLDNKPREWLLLGSNLSFNQTNENLTSSQENIISNALQLSPAVPVRNMDGSWGGAVVDVNHPENQFVPVNPVAIATLATNANTRRQFLGGLNMGIRIIKDLNFRTSINTNVNYSGSQYYIPTYKIGWAENVTANLQERNGTSTYWNWNQQLEYNKQFGDHNLNAMLGHESQESKWKNLGASRTGFLTNDILDLSAGDALSSSTSGGSGLFAMESYFGRLNYNFKDRYIFSGTLRGDGSANFGPENRWGVFPSASLAWRVSKENFFNIPAINEFKLRFETGLTGNQGGYGYIYSPMVAGSTPNGTGFLPGRYSNPALKWEETLTNNVGINLGFLDDRIQLEADYYVKSTDNLLLTAPLSWYMGSNGEGAVEAPQRNIASLENKGWGITLNTVNINRKNFRWTTNLNLSGFKTNITKLNTDNAFIERVSWWMDNWAQRSLIGESPWLFRGYIEEGIFQSVEEINNSAVPIDNNGNRLATDETTGIWVGDVKYKDISGPNGVPDNKIDVNDLANIGNPWPTMFGGFTNDFTYKGFNLSILLTSTIGNDVYNYMARTNSNPNNINLGRNLLINTMDYAKPVLNTNNEVVLENPGTNVARISYGPNGNYTRITDKWVEDGSFVRLKNISLAYTVPTSLISKQKLIRNIRLAFSAQNLATITGYKGFDPEIGGYVGRDVNAANQAIGVDNGRYPLTPVYTFTFGLDF